MLKITLNHVIIVIVAAVALGAGTTASAQQRFDVAVTYTAERAKVTNNCGCFWLQGGGIEAGAALWHGFGPAASFTGLHTGAVGSQGVSLSLITATFGPRYRYVFSQAPGLKPKALSIYGEGLVGVAHGFDSIFPAASGQQSSSSALATQFGGGIDASITPHLAVRPIALDWARTQLPNGTNNVQNNLRISAGVVLRFGRRD